MSPTAVTNSSSASSATSASSLNSTSAADTSDRFLKMLVAQMKNQDPLNPMDNAQVTSQMAQINTVTGIDKLNTTVSGLTNSFSQMQMLQSASLVGHQVIMEGSKLYANSSGQAMGGFTLDAAAESVRIDIVNSAGVTVDTISDSAVPAGQNTFSWTPPSGTSLSDLSFKVTATSSGKVIGATPLMTDTIDAVTNSNGTLNLELRNQGSTPYSKVKTIG